MFVIAPLLAVIVCSTGQEQALQRKVDYRTAGVPARVALQALSERGKVPLRASRELAEEPLILSLSQVPVKEVMDRLATCMKAEWKKASDGSYELYRPPELMAKVHGEAVRRRADRLKTAVKAKLAEIEKHGPLTQERARQVATSLANLATKPENEELSQDGEARNALRVALPDPKALWSAVSKMDPAELADIPPGVEVAFSTLPNRLQRPIGGSALAALTGWREEHNRFREEYVRALGGRQVTNRSWGDGDLDAPMDAEPARIDVFVHRTLGSDGLDFTLLAFDKEGGPMTVRRRQGEPDRLLGGGKACDYEG